MKLRVETIDINSPLGASRFGAFARFSQVLADFEHVNRRGRVLNGEIRDFRSGRDRGKPYYQSLANYLLHYARDAYEDFEGEQNINLDSVDILTVHQAKGLEWPIVFLPSLVEGRFPSRLSGRPQAWLLSPDIFPDDKRKRYEGSESEERRLFYVAMTRARDCLYLSTFERKTNRFQPSTFLLEVANGIIPQRDSLQLPNVTLQTSSAPEPTLEISLTDIASFDECGYRYRLSAVLGFQQELAIELGYGKAIHHVLRQLAEVVRASGQIPGPVQLQQLVDEEFYLPYATAPAFQRMHQAATRLLNRYVCDYKEDMERVWATERAFELHLEGSVVTGRADVILANTATDPNGLAIVDYKVAHDPMRDERYQLQLAVYAAAARGEGLNVDNAYLHELKDGNRRTVDVDETAVAVAIETVSGSVRSIRQGTYQAKPEPGRCRSCAFHRMCPHRVNVLE